uniref:Chemokine interleukin-8-like domain-containing protein n=1 Tax=Oryzias latipes TaxID=8090 RepID=A0A3P9H531_ORYLA
MKLVIQSIILLVCGVVCNSAILKCQCLRTSKTVQPSLIKKVQEFPPRPYCSKLEIIITLKNNVKVCLDPTHKFAKAVLESTKVQAEVRTMGSTTTTTAATAVSTWSKCLFLKDALKTKLKHLKMNKASF